MILRQWLHTEPVALSYLFGCGSRAAAAVVDPIGDIDGYVSEPYGPNGSEEATEQNLKANGANPEEIDHAIRENAEA